jgi:hypothetical protein
VAIFGGLIASTMRERFYRLGPSPLLADLADRTGVGPRPLAKWLRENKRTGGRLRRYIDAVEQDTIVYAAALVYAARQDPAELADQIGHALFDPPPLDDDERVAQMSPDELKEHLEEQRRRQKENTKRDAVIVALIMAGVVLLGLLFMFDW